ncbi:hypothetical protein RH915_00540 [Serpentinicella sp. ANB-PHB4]|uniref:hypothetical protein n=1 Tax=Serpentinicella sp. ANB-PHB4 TaxID=3074076 RepID=UPI002857B6BD|nr:hypothetical protein [Serpentinicella sp. ANB-PHB4]MDR5657965.1 hypothetical protein [Serpentinicella sp. ANB-PHB4]
MLRMERKRLIRKRKRRIRLVITSIFIMLIVGIVAVDQSTETNRRIVRIERNNNEITLFMLGNEIDLSFIRILNNL